MSSLFTYLSLPKLLQWLPLECVHSEMDLPPYCCHLILLLPLLKILWCFSVGWQLTRHAKIIYKVWNYLQLPSNFPSHESTTLICKAYQLQPSSVSEIACTHHSSVFHLPSCLQQDNSYCSSKSRSKSCLLNNRCYFAAITLRICLYCNLHNCTCLLSSWTVSFRLWITLFMSPIRTLNNKCASINDYWI